MYSYFCPFLVKVVSKLKFYLGFKRTEWGVCSVQTLDLCGTRQCKLGHPAILFRIWRSDFAFASPSSRVYIIPRRFCNPACCKSCRITRTGRRFSFWKYKKSKNFYYHCLCEAENIHWDWPSFLMESIKTWICHLSYKQTR